MNRFLKLGFLEEINGRAFTVIGVTAAEVTVTAVTDNDLCAGGVCVKTADQT